jgi:hypothetical protein
METILPDIQKVNDTLESVRPLTSDAAILKAIDDCQQLLGFPQPEAKLWRSSLYQKTFFWVVICVLIASVIFIYQGVDFSTPPKKNIPTTYSMWDMLIYGTWIIGPPCFFLIEYTYIFGADGKNRMNSAQRDDIKYCQDLAAKIWAAVAVFLSILLTIKYGSPFK